MKKLYYKIRRKMAVKGKSPEYLARSTAWGMGMAFAPFIGQIPLMVAIWFMFRRTKYRFSLAVSVVWTFISNIFTNLPLFYLFYIFGSWVRQSQATLSYAEIKTKFGDNIFSGLHYTITEMGTSFLLGSAILMLFFSIFGYALGYFSAKKLNG